MRSPRRSKLSIHTSTQPSFLTKIGKFLIGLLALGLVVAAVLILWIVFFLPARWNENSTKNIVIVPSNIDVNTNVILFASISYTNDSLSYSSLPANDTVRLAGGYGEYPLKSVFPLLGLDQKPDQTVIATYSHLLGIPIDEVWVTSEDTIFQEKSTVQDLAYQVLLGKLETPLSLKDRLKFYRFASGKQSTRVNFSTLAEWQAKQASRFIGLLKDCRASLVNTTAVAGLGRRVSKVMEQSGMTVVRLTDAAPTVGKSTITILPNSETCMFLATHVKQLFPESLQIKEDSEILTRARSEAEIILGQDIGNFLSD